MGTQSQNNLNLSGSDSEEDMEQTNQERIPSTPESSNAPKETRGKAKGMSDTPNTKKKVWLTLDHHEHPCHPIEEVHRFSSECGVLARRDVRICYDTFPIALEHTLVDVFETLDSSFGFVGRPSIKTAYTKKVMGEAWRRHKSNLYKKLVKGKSPAILKEGPAPEGVNLEDWRVFVDMCNTSKFQAASKRNSINRLKQTSPACVGRTPTQIIRQQIAKELNKPVHKVTRPESYIRIHKRKSPCTEGVEWEERINEDMSTNLGSPMTILDDAVTRVVGKDSRGRCRAMGPGVNKTSMKKMEPVLEQNYYLAEENSKLWKETQTNHMNFAIQIEELRSLVLSQQDRSSATNSFGTSSSVPHSCNATSPEVSKIGKQVNLLGGWPLDIVATGYVKEVDPTYKFHERCLGERSYLVYVDEVHVHDAALPCPHDAWCKNIGESCPGNVIWPKSCVEFLPSTSQS